MRGIDTLVASMSFLGIRYSPGVWSDARDWAVGRTGLIHIQPPHAEHLVQGANSMLLSVAHQNVPGVY
jgi:hypothetical protein